MTDEVTPALREMEFERPERFYSLQEYLKPITAFMFQTERKFVRDRHIHGFLQRKFDMEPDIDDLKNATRAMEELGVLRPYRNLINPEWRVNTYTSSDYVALQNAYDAIEEEDNDAWEWITEDLEAEIEAFADSQLSIYDFE